MRIRTQGALVLLLALPLFAEIVDRVVATVNGRPVMESELNEQLRFEQFLAARPAQVVPATEQRAVLMRLVDQLLLEQQMDLTNFGRPADEEVSKRVEELRKQLGPTAAAWQDSLMRYGLTEADVAERVAMQLRALNFIDARFRPACRVDPGAVEVYYREQLVPKLKQARSQPPPLKQVEPSIREILVQQQMDDLLESWLKTLRTQTEIRMALPSSAVGAVQPATQPQAAEVR